MRYNQTSIFSIRAVRMATAGVMLLFAGAFLKSCASIGQLDGGPYDTIPPVVLGVYPNNYATNFKDKRITLDFNEYVQIKEQQKELFTSPAMKKPTITLRGKSLIVDLKADTLLPNTTYAIEFGAAIADNNEGNPLHGLRYVFSTGDRIDSMIMSGYTEKSETADSLGKTFIYFFEADSVAEPKEWDSTMFNYSPSKIARSQNNGIFIAQNLRPVDYRVYAFNDTNGNQIYEPSVDMVGFLDGVYNPSKMPPFGVWYDSIRRYPSADPQLYFRLFTDKNFARQSMQDAVRPEQHKILITFAAEKPEIRSIKLNGIDPDSIIYEPSLKGDSLTLWLNMRGENIPDSLKGEMIYMKHDSLRQLQPDTAKLNLNWRRVESKQQEREREKLEKAKAKAEANGEEWTEPDTPSQFRILNFKNKYDVNPEQHYPLSFATPLTRLDSARVQMLSWGEEGDTIKERITFVRDTANMRRWLIKANWDAKRKYSLRLPKDVMFDVAGEGNDSLNSEITVADIDKFAKLNLTIKPRTEGGKYVVQFVDGQNNKSIIREIRHLGEGTHTINYIPAGELRMRIIEDINDNGEWDGGNMVERRQSERAEFYKNERDEEIFTTKTGWEFDITLDMSRIFAPVTMEQLIEILDKREAIRIVKAEEKRREEARKKQGQGHNHDHGGGMGGFGGMMGGSGGLGGMMGGSGMQQIR
ncbi:MAG: Ig-like domain-containing protein [Alistipes sp.]|nr:Ig-like domain-containing protein [Alistipes sp.]MBQ4126376.1 Ig-like domain-containing protein [Alistipes sp.]